MPYCKNIGDLDRILRSSTFYSQSAKTLNGYGLYAEEITKALCKMTLNINLDALTMIPWKDLFDKRGKGLLKPRKGWCPKCFNDQKNASGQRYEPLSWAVRLSEVCNIHSIELVYNCPRCGLEQQFLSKFSPVGYCSSCGHDLSILEDYDIQSKILDENLKWFTDKIGKMIASGHYAKKYATAERFVDSVTKVTVLMANGNAEKISIAMNFGKDTIGQWRRGRNLPNFSTFLHFLFCINCDPITFFSEKEFKIKTAFAEISSRANYREKRVVLDRNHDLIKHKLIRLTNASDAQSSLAMTARNLRVSKGYLYHRFPEQSQDIIGKHKEFAKTRSLRRNAALKDKVVSAVRKLAAAKIYPSKRRVFSDEFGLSYSDHFQETLRNTWRKAKKEEGF